MEVDGVDSAAIVSKKRKRISKNTKKYWKKDCDIKDVEEYLNDQRLQAKSGGTKSEAPDEKLFFVDSKAKKSISKLKSAKQRKKERIARIRCYASLEPDPNVEPVAQKRSRPVTKGSLKHTRLKKREEIRLGRLKQIQADMQRVDVVRARRQRQAVAAQRLVHGTDTNHYYSLWNELSTGKPLREEEFIEHTKAKPIKPPGHFYFKPSRLPPIEPAHPGLSYNPTFECQQDLLRAALTVEEKRKKNEEKWAKEASVKKISKRQFQRNETRELTSGLFDDPKTDEQSDTVGSLSSTAVGVKGPTKRRTKAARRHELLEKKKVARLQKAKKLKALSNDVYKLKSIEATIRNGEASHTDKIHRRWQIRRSRLDDPKRLGPNRYVPPEIEYKLTGEMVGSLREMKPVGSVLRDRFKSFQKRNILRPTVPVRAARAKKKRRPKHIEKREVKEITL